MANRTTAAEVKQIMDNCTVSDTIVDQYITAANLTVTDLIGSDTTLSDAQKEEIERWYTGHMLAVTICKTTTREKLGDAEAVYTGQFKMGLDSTPYGQMVKQLDTTGKMGNIGKRGASIHGVTSFD